MQKKDTHWHWLRWGGGGKVNISTIIAWKRRYEATGDVKMKIRRSVNKKIISEKHAPFDNIEQVYEF